MDLTDQLKVIRTLDGWNSDPKPAPQDCSLGMGITAGGKPNWYYSYELPQYDKDLDEILRVVRENVSNDLRSIYTQNLISVVKRSLDSETSRGIIATFYILVAKPEEHMEALLRTLGSWKERDPDPKGELTSITLEFIGEIKKYYGNIPKGQLTQIFARGPWAGWSEREVLTFVEKLESQSQVAEK